MATVDQWLKEFDDETESLSSFPWPSCADHFKFTNTNNKATESWYEWELQIEAAAWPRPRLDRRCGRPV